MTTALQPGPANAEDVSLVTANSHGEYFRVGSRIVVLWMPKYGKYLCLTCVTNSCKHTSATNKHRVP